MNERLANLLAMVHQTAIQAGTVAADAAYGAGKMADELLSVAKLNIRIMERKMEVDRCLREVGEILYATHTGMPSDSDLLLAKLQEIDALKAEIATLKAEIRQEELMRICPTCGAGIQDGDMFCRECGGKL